MLQFKAFVMCCSSFSQQFTLKISSDDIYICKHKIRDFNAKSKNWYSGNKTNREDNKCESLTSQCRFKQLISHSTHI